jgi:hypothetical protein
MHAPSSSACKMSNQACQMDETSSVSECGRAGAVSVDSNFRPNSERRLRSRPSEATSESNLGRKVRCSDGESKSVQEVVGELSGFIYLMSMVPGWTTRPEFRLPPPPACSSVTLHVCFHGDTKIDPSLLAGSLLVLTADFAR